MKNNMLTFYKGKRVLITGNTGFKGSWLSKILLNAGADVYGIALQPQEENSLFNLLKLDRKSNCCFADIRDFETMKRFINSSRPEIVIHLAAQPLVNFSYEHPRYTYEVNVMGTVNILQALCDAECCESFLNVTTDKVYKNNEWIYGYREVEELNGYDPYSNSKSCSELVTQCYRRSIVNGLFPVSTARAGNVIGGGDFAKDRIVPDCLRTIEETASGSGGGVLRLRNPYSIRPYQHVLEPLFVYLLILKKQFENKDLAGEYNIGPNMEDCITTLKITQLLNQYSIKKFKVATDAISKFHEANYLKLDCSKMKSIFNWKPVYNINIACQKVMEWTQHYWRGEDVNTITDMQIAEYSKCFSRDIESIGE